MTIVEYDDYEYMEAASDYYDSLAPSERRRLVRLALDLYRKTKEYHKLLLSEEYGIDTELEVALDAMREAQAVFNKAIGGRS